MTLSSLEISLCFILVLSYPWSIANFAFCFSSSLRTDCHIIVSAVSEVSSEMELTRQYHLMNLMEILEN